MKIMANIRLNIQLRGIRSKYNDSAVSEKSVMMVKVGTLPLFERFVLTESFIFDERGC